MFVLLAYDTKDSVRMVFGPFESEDAAFAYLKAYMPNPLSAFYDVLVVIQPPKGANQPCA